MSWFEIATTSLYKWMFSFISGPYHLCPLQTKTSCHHHLNLMEMERSWDTGSCRFVFSLPSSPWQSLPKQNWRLCQPSPSPAPREPAACSQQGLPQWADRQLRQLILKLPDISGLQPTMWNRRATGETLYIVTDSCHWANVWFTTCTRLFLFRGHQPAPK